MRAPAFLFMLLFASPAIAQLSAADEDRARDVGAGLRCVVCQNQSIEESEAPLALDMRRIVRERIAAGDTDAQVTAYMRDRYGDYVLLKPPVQANTYALWFLPALLIGGMGIWLLRRRTVNVVETAEMNAVDRARLATLLERDQ